MKHLLIASAMLLATSGAWAESLYVRTVDRDILLGEISTVESLTFPDEGATVTLTDGQSYTFAYEDFVAFRTSGDLSTGTEIISDHNICSLNGRTLQVSESVRVYTLDGKLVKLCAEGSNSLAALPAGAYVIKSKCVTFKVVLK